MRDGFVFYRSFAEALDDLDDTTFRAVTDALMWYALDGKQPELTGIASAIFKLIKPQIDANTRRYENGKKGGRPKKEEPEKPTTTKAVRKSSAEKRQEEVWFEQFWAEYPRKVAKPTARLKFIAKCKDEETFNRIMFGLKLHKKSWNDPQFIPHPATWLNQERWNDKPTLSRSANFTVTVPEYITMQESGQFDDGGEATQEQIDEIKKWQEMMR